MNQEEVYSVWAPQDSIWSPWVAPVLFAQTYWDTRIKAEPATPRPLPWLPKDLKDTAVIVDLPGASSAEVGFALAAAGFRPIPLYNASPGPEQIIGIGSASPSPSNAVIDMGPIVDAISRVTSTLARMNFSPQAAPAFLLDSDRTSGTKAATTGMFDNRWMVFPQDFPSANFLQAQGIRRALLVQQHKLEPREDLAHTLLRWQQGGIAILSKRLNIPDGAADDAPPTPTVVKRPSMFRAAWYRALTQMGLRRSSAGGFGSYIPEMGGSG
jgi:hypothetical protein